MPNRRQTSYTSGTERYEAYERVLLCKELRVPTDDDDFDDDVLIIIIYIYTLNSQKP